MTDGNVEYIVWARGYEADPKAVSASCPEVAAKMYVRNRFTSSCDISPTPGNTQKGYEICVVDKAGKELQVAYLSITVTTKWWEGRELKH